MSTYKLANYTTFATVQYPNGYRFIRVSPQAIAKCLLVASVLMSVLSIIYLKAIQHHKIAALEAAKQQYIQLRTQEDQLRAVHKTWATPERIRAVAKLQLNMATPKASEIIRHPKAS